MQVESIFHAPTGFLAGDDVAEVGDGENVFLNSAAFGFGEAFDSIRGEDQIEIEGPVFELDEVLAPDDFGLGVVVENEASSSRALTMSCPFSTDLAGKTSTSWVVPG